MPVDPNEEISVQEVHLLHFLLENIPDRIYFKDRQSRFIRVSRAMAEFFRVESPQAVVGKTDFDFFTLEHAQPAFDDEQQIIRTGEAIIGKVEKETLPDGRIVWAITTKMPLRDGQGAIVGTCGVSKDFTTQKALEDALAESNDQLEQALGELSAAHENRKAMQQQLVEAEKMRMFGQLACGVAHEIRNPLNILNMGLEFFASEPAITQNATYLSILEEMRTGVRRADAVICALMDSSSKGNFKFEACPLELPIRAALQAADAELRHHQIRVVTDFATDLPPLNLDRGKMEQVFEGIFKNAIDAMPGGGELTVRTQRSRLTETEIERNPGLRSGDRFRTDEIIALVEIDDTGEGIPLEALSKVFEPFFTTKDTGSGTGLSLTICRKIVELHHGILQIGNREGGGAKAAILLKLETGQ